MRRPVLLTLAAVGGIIVMLGGTGIFAALTDTARSGTNSIDTDALPPSSDLRAATAELVGSTISCGSFSDNLASALITVSGPPGSNSPNSYFFCLRNVGSQTINVTSQADEFTDVEIECTGDESVFDLTCGSGPGDLGDIVTVLHAQYDCATGAPINPAPRSTCFATPSPRQCPSAFLAPTRPTAS